MDVIAGSSIGLSGEELSIRMCSMRGGDVGWRGEERGERPGRETTCSGEVTRVDGHVSAISLPFTLSFALFIISLLATFINKRSLNYHRIL